MEEAQVDTLTRDLGAEFGEIVDNETLRAVVEARAHRYDEAVVQDFVQLFVEREVRQALKRIA